MTPTHPTPELVALVTDDTVQIALDASDAYWNADDRLEKCLACNGTGKVPCGESQDWCDCDGGTVNNGTEAGAMRAALDAVEATRAATVPQGVWLPIESAPRDGSVVLAWRFYPVAIKWTGGSEYPWEAVNLGSHPSTTLHSNGFMEADSSLTHWQPLPTPPPAELGEE